MAANSSSEDLKPH